MASDTRVMPKRKGRKEQASLEVEIVYITWGKLTRDESNSQSTCYGVFSGAVSRNFK